MDVKFFGVCLEVFILLLRFFSRWGLRCVRLSLGSLILGEGIRVGNFCFCVIVALFFVYFYLL